MPKMVGQVWKQIQKSLTVLWANTHAHLIWEIDPGETLSACTHTVFADNKNIVIDNKKKIAILSFTDKQICRY